MRTLSILIVTIPEREMLFNKLLNNILDQRKEYGVKNVEVRVLFNNHKIPIGEARNNLLEAATKDYVCFIDDDDKIADDYVATIMKAINSPEIGGADGYGFLLKYTETRNGVLAKVQMAHHSGKYARWETVKEGFMVGASVCTYKRTLNHLNPIRRELALQAGFTEKNFGEDHDYSKSLAPLIKTSYDIDKVMYFYDKVI